MVPKAGATVVSSSYNANPLELPLPAGTYDIGIEYGTAAYEQEGVVSGSVTSWITGLTVQSGQTITQDSNLRLTAATVILLEAPDKHARAGALQFQVFAASRPEIAIASALTDTAHLELPEGTFTVVSDY